MGAAQCKIAASRVYSKIAASLVKSSQEFQIE